MGKHFSATSTPPAPGARATTVAVSVGRHTGVNCPCPGENPPFHIEEFFGGNSCLNESVARRSGARTGFAVDKYVLVSGQFRGNVGDLPVRAQLIGKRQGYDFCLLREANV